MKKIHRLLSITIVIALFWACNNKENINQEGDLIKKTEIGQQVWAAENLNVTHFRDGDLIPEAKNLDEYFKYQDEKKPCWCYYEFEQKNESIYGKLYNWYAVNDSRNLAPEGWRTPTKEDWEELIDFSGGSDMAASKLKSVELNLWIKQSESAKDTYGFSAKPGGFFTCMGDMGDGFWSLRRVGAWWCSNSIDDDNANSIWMYSKDDYSSENEIKISEEPKRYAFSVRIINEKKSDKKVQENSSQVSGAETKIMTYKYCECHEMCYSLFTDEQGNEYNFGDISRQSNIGFQCYPNNSEGGISDDLKEQKFIVTYIKISKNDFELIKIESTSNNPSEDKLRNHCSVCGKDFDGNGYEEQSDGSWQKLPSHLIGSVCSPACGRKSAKRFNDVAKKYGIDIDNSKSQEYQKGVGDYNMGKDGRVYENQKCSLCRGTGIEKGVNPITGQIDKRTCPMCEGRGVRSY